MSYLHHLDPASGPPCTRCGCRDTTITQRPPEGVTSWWAMGRARCNHCRNSFSFRELPLDPREAAPVVASDVVAGNGEVHANEPATPRDTAYPVRECPECGSPNVKVVSSPKAKPGRPKTRYHECKDCPATFKSIDSRQRITS